jgi:hypothetical protein
MLGIGGCSAADLRPSELCEGGSTETHAGRTLLNQVAERHGLHAWQAHKTLRAKVVDRWADGAQGWWPLQEQWLKLEYVLGTFTSRAELLNGDRAGEIWGIHAWQPYHRATPNHELEFENTREKMTLSTFYLPALQYLSELPFRLLNAEYVLYAGQRLHEGKDYHLIFATWGSVEPNEQHDQYLLWINQETLLVEMCRYTLRDAGPIFTGSIHYDGYRDIEGVMFPFAQTVTLPRPENTLYPLHRYYFHRLEFESVGFDEVDKGTLLVGSSKPAQDAK